MKTITIRIAIGTTIASLGMAVTAVPEAKAGGVYWNDHNGGGVSRGYTYGSNYYGGQDVVTGPNGACSCVYYGRR